MQYQYNDCLEHIPALKTYVQTKIKTHHWKDVVQDTLVYLFLKFDTIEVTNIKGLLINTSNFFIQKHYTAIKKDTKIENIKNTLSLNISPDVKIGKYNSYLIDDSLFNSINTVSKSLLIPFQLQLNGYSIQEISDKLNTKENTIKTRIRRCKGILKDTVEL